MSYNPSELLTLIIAFLLVMTFSSIRFYKNTARFLEAFLYMIIQFWLSLGIGIQLSRFDFGKFFNLSLSKSEDTFIGFPLGIGGFLVVYSLFLLITLFKQASKNPTECFTFESKDKQFYLKLSPLLVSILFYLIIGLIVVGILLLDLMQTVWLRNLRGPIVLIELVSILLPIAVSPFYQSWINKATLWVVKRSGNYQKLIETHK